VYFLNTIGVEQARTAAFTVLVFGQLLLALGFRSEDRPLWKLPLLGNWKLLVVIAASIVFQFFCLQNASLGHLLKTSPLSLSTGGTLLTIACLPLLSLEVMKVWMNQTGRKV
jgi:Ca2+-transporting ATPase